MNRGTGLWRRTTAEEIGKTYHSLTDHIYLGGKKHSKIKKGEQRERYDGGGWRKHWTCRSDTRGHCWDKLEGIEGEWRVRGKWEEPCMLLPLPSLKDDISLR